MTDNLTGVWDGTYVQPQVGMVTFLATLIDSGGALGGNVTEPCIRPDCPLGGPTTLRLRVIDPAARSRSSNVTSHLATAMTRSLYEGMVNADATEIDGRWRLPAAVLEHF